MYFNFALNLYMTLSSAVKLTFSNNLDPDQAEPMYFYSALNLYLKVPSAFKLCKHDASVCEYIYRGQSAEM